MIFSVIGEVRCKIRTISKMKNYLKKHKVRKES